MAGKPLGVILVLGLLYGGLGSAEAPAQPLQDNAAAATDTVEQVRLAKSPTGAMIRSLVFPGWGQWYNGQKLKAGLFFVAESALIARIVIANKELRKAKTPEEEFRLRDRRNLTFWWLGGTVLLSMLDAYVDAYLYDFDTGPELALRLQPSAGEVTGVELGLQVRF